MTISGPNFGWDLPPGVRISDIPGNRPEDEAEDRFFDILAERWGKDWPDFSRELDELCERYGNENLQDAIFQYALVARDIGYMQGYKEAQNDAETIKAMEHDRDFDANLEAKHIMEDHTNATEY